MDFKFSSDLEFALSADRGDSLAGFRSEFIESEDDLIYLDGNSLGKLPKRTIGLLDDVTRKQWGDQLIRSWNSDWIGINKRIGAKIAELIGAKPHEVILTDSTSLNLFKLAYACLKLQGSGRDQIVSDELNFPSDLYILQGLVDMFGSRHELVLAECCDGLSIDNEELVSLITDKTALVSLSYVSFKSSYMYNMEQITRIASEKGAMMIWDLSHAVGAVPIELNKCGAGMAVGCTYKYLNGGPGSIAFLYVREDLIDKLVNPVWGWFADQNPFQFELDFQPSKDINRFTTSTTPILSAAGVEPGLDIMLEASIKEVRLKSVKLSEYLIYLFDKWLAPLGFDLGSPRDSDKRGSHVSIRHPEANRISKAMITPKNTCTVVVPDFRAPDFIRLGLTPLYLGYQDIYRAMFRIKEIVVTKEYQEYSNNQDTVT